MQHVTLLPKRKRNLDSGMSLISTIATRNTDKTFENTHQSSDLMTIDERRFNESFIT